MNIAEAYERVNAAKPEAVTKLTLPEAAAAVRKMYRHLTGWKFPYSVVETSGNRNTWLWHGVFRVNVSNGWDNLIHLFSHWYHRTKVGGRPHSKSHARIELKLRKWAIARGWFGGSLRKPEPFVSAQLPSAVEQRDARIAKRTAQVARLERKIKALATRLKKAKRSLAGLLRAKGKAETP